MPIKNRFTGVIFGSEQVEHHWPDRLFKLVLRAVALGVVLLLVGIVANLFKLSWPALQKMGLSLFISSDWDPVNDSFGAWPLIFGTVVSSLLGVALSVPVSLSVALFLTELAPRAVAAVFGYLVQMLAAIPSVVYGLWGIFVLAPWLRVHVEPFLGSHFGFLPLFQGPPYGVGMLAAGMILAIMITPTISSICREVFRSVPDHQREAALGLGATRWEMIRISIVRASRSGVVGAVMMGLGRALGETMAVTMVIGNRHEVSYSLFAPGQTMASAIANEYAEATGDLHVAALGAVGLALFGVSFAFNAAARWWVKRGMRA